MVKNSRQLSSRQVISILLFLVVLGVAAVSFLTYRHLSFSDCSSLHFSNSSLYCLINSSKNYRIQFLNRRAFSTLVTIANSNTPAPKWRIYYVEMTDNHTQSSNIADPESSHGVYVGHSAHTVDGNRRRLELFFSERVALTHTAEEMNRTLANMLTRALSDTYRDVEQYRMTGSFDQEYARGIGYIAELSAENLPLQVSVQQ